MSSRRRSYVLVSPCRDEARYMRRTLESVSAQTVLPALWVVVDDGSTDETPAILADYGRRLPYLRVVRRPDRGRRAVGPGVIEAFYAGLDTVNLDDFEYLCKLDLDLELPAVYFERLIARMEAEPRVGTTSGKPWFRRPGRSELEPEICGDEMSVGMTKFYRVQCFREIGGFAREVMWDGIDCHTARQLGWLAESRDDEAIRFVHLRPQGISHKSIWKGRVRAGYGQYYMGTSPLYYLASAAFRLLEYPVLIGSTAMLWGYLRSALARAPRHGTAEFRRFVRRYQHACLLRGKKAATAELDRRQEAVWRAAHPARAEETASAPQPATQGAS